MDMEQYTGSTSFSDRSKSGNILHNFAENRRDEKECQKLNETNEMYHPYSHFHYDAEIAKMNETLVECKNLEEAYEKVLGPSVEAFNARQKRKDRQTSVEKVVENYIKKGGDACQSLIVQVGNAESAPSPEVCEMILKEYKDEFEKRFPNMVIVSAYIHKDEDRRLNPKYATGTMHEQMYILPIKKKSLCSEEQQKKWRGPDVQLGLTAALEQMGYDNSKTIMVEKKDKEGNPILDEKGKPILVEGHDYKNGALAQFQKDFNSLLDEICLKHNIEILHPQKGQKVSHEDQRAYKEGKLTEEIAQLKEEKNFLQEKKESLETEKIYMEETISSLKSEKNGLESQIVVFKERVAQIVEHFEFLVKKVENRVWGDLFKQRKAEAAIRSGNKEKETIKDYLKENDLQSKIPIDSLGRFIGATQKLEDLDEEWERD